MKKTTANILKIIFSFILIVALVVSADLSSLFNTIIQSNYYWLILSIILGVLCIYIATIKWHVLLMRFNVPINHFHLFRLICFGIFYNTFIPGGFAGDFFRGYKCKNQYLNATQGIASVFVDRILGLVSFMIIGLIGMLLTFNIVKDKNIIYIFLIVALFTAITLVLLFHRKLIKFISYPSKRFAVIYDKLRQLYDSIYFYKNYTVIIISALLLALFSSVGNTVCFYSIGISIGCDVSFLYYLFFIPIITVISYLPISYGGLGLREAGFVLLFGQLGIPREQALAISLMYFALLVILGIAGGLIFILTD